MADRADRTGDEVMNPERYRTLMIERLGDRDALEVMGETAGVLRGLVSGVDGASLGRRPRGGGWSAAEVLGHLVDAEWALGVRTRAVLSEDKPMMIGFDQELWVEALGHGRRAAVEWVDEFAVLRGVNLRLWRGLGEGAMDRVGLHNERGEESLGLMLRMYAGHDLAHIAQIRRVLGEAV